MIDMSLQMAEATSEGSEGGKLTERQSYYQTTRRTPEREII